MHSSPAGIIKSCRIFHLYLLDVSILKPVGISCTYCQCVLQDTGILQQKTIKILQDSRKECWIVLHDSKTYRTCLHILLICPAGFHNSYRIPAGILQKKIKSCRIPVGYFCKGNKSKIQPRKCLAYIKCACETLKV